MTPPSTAPAVFLDTSYFIALFNRRDRFHARAVEAARRFAHGNTPMMTTDAVLIEIGNALSPLPARALAAQIIAAVREAAAIEVARVDAPLFERGLALFRQRMDKEWGLTDCISFALMQQRGVTQALTADHHFEQAGFQIVL